MHDGGDRQPLPDQTFGDAIARCDLRDIQPGLLQGGKSLVLVDLVHGETGDVLAERCFHRLSILAILHHHAGDGIGDAVPGQFDQCVVAPLSGDDLVAAGRASASTITGFAGGIGRANINRASINRASLASATALRGTSVLAATSTFASAVSASAIVGTASISSIIGTVFYYLSHQKRLDDAQRPDGGEKVGDLLAADLAYIEGRERQLL